MRTVLTPTLSAIVCAFGLLLVTPASAAPPAGPLASAFHPSEAGILEEVRHRRRWRRAYRYYRPYYRPWYRPYAYYRPYYYGYWPYYRPYYRPWYGPWYGPNVGFWFGF